SEGVLDIDGSALNDFGLYLEFKGRGIPRKVLRELNAQIEWENGRPFVDARTVQQRHVGLLAKLQSILEEAPEVYGEESNANDFARVDRKRLFVYYTLDWIL